MDFCFVCCKWTRIFCISYTTLQPGNFYSTDLLKVRGDLLRNHICPHMMLDGCGAMMALKYNNCVVHRWPKDAHICLKFLEEYPKVRHHSLQYRGESLPMFCQIVFDDLCRATHRPFITKDVKRELAGMQKNQCAVC